MKKSLQIHRLGGKYEAAGFLVILAGLAMCLAYESHNLLGLGLVTMGVGFVVFLVGRFL